MEKLIYEVCLEHRRCLTNYSVIFSDKNKENAKKEMQKYIDKYGEFSNVVLRARLPDGLTRFVLSCNPYYGLLNCCGRYGWNEIGGELEEITE